MKMAPTQRAGTPETPAYDCSWISGLWTEALVEGRMMQSTVISPLRPMSGKLYARQRGGSDPLCQNPSLIIFRKPLREEIIYVHGRNLAQILPIEGRKKCGRGIQIRTL